PLPGADPENYLLEGIGSPDSAAYDPSKAVIFLFWDIQLDEGREYILMIRLLEDLAGNRSLDFHSSFIYHDIKPVIPGSVVINEIMADPLPSVGLPAFEFIEIMNISGSYLLLDGCRLNNKQIERMIIPSKGFALLADDDAGNVFSKYTGVSGPVRYWDNLNNEDDEVVLTDKNGEILDAVSYNKDWIDDLNKKNGGWSFELINPDYKCWGRKSWKISVASAGGTPGAINSVFSEKVENLRRGFDDYWAEGKFLWLDFADPMDGTMSPENFSITGNSVLEIVAEPENPNQVRLSLSDSLYPGIPGTLAIRNLKDCSQTYKVDTSVILGIGIEPSFLELIFTEVMIDPTPSHGLPEEEFIEIYNPTDKIISLGGCCLIAGSDTVVLPDKNILPKEFRILCRSNVDDVAFPRPVYVPGFPGISNDGERLSIIRNDSALVFDLDLNMQWFPGGFPAGISLEMTDINNPCGKSSNWSPSSDRDGGSPGRTNTNQSPNPDNLGPSLESVSAIDDRQVLLRFSEPVHAGSVFESNITVNGRHFIRDFRLITFTEIICNTLESFKQGIIYELKIRNITDCVGNLILNPDPIKFGVPLPADSADIVINEVLFNPRTTGFDFIEILNRSEKFIDLHQWHFSGTGGLTGDGGSLLSEVPFVVSPGSIKAFTTNRTRTLNEFPQGNSANIIEVDKIPAMNDDSGSILILSGEGKLIDRFDYDEEIHFLLLDNFEGVSLERVDPDRPTNDPLNWHSASERNGFGTPGNTNSTIPSDTLLSGKIDIIPDVFSPDGPVSLNEAIIYFNFGRPGFVANIFIFDINGRMIRRLANNELIPASGFFSWDGKNENGSKAGMGYYIVVFETFHLDGTHKIFKDKVAVGRRF
ncbi:MAG TPA: lamin tail domain-containing protein, partial [Cyclobacteriaceae bacterium]|nr:lamin tail domain-containing protein [Cyclobacteriaceae bacterium]